MHGSHRTPTTGSQAAGVPRPQGPHDELNCETRKSSLFCNTQTFALDIQIVTKPGGATRLEAMPRRRRPTLFRPCTLAPEQLFDSQDSWQLKKATSPEGTCICRTGPWDFQQKFRISRVLSGRSLEDFEGLRRSPGRPKELRSEPLVSYSRDFLSNKPPLKGPSFDSR